MTIHGSKSTATRRLSASQKLALASGAGAALAGAFVPHSAEAGIVQSTTLPLSPPSSSGENYWDVDGDGSNDFGLFGYIPRPATTPDQTTGPPFAALKEFNAGRFVIPNRIYNGTLAKLASGVTVGPNLGNAYRFSTVARTRSITGTGVTAGGAFNGGWTRNNPGSFGFKFSNASGVHYGWGQMLITGTPQGSGFTLTSAYYNDTPGASITVGDTGGSPSAVPEIDPTSAGGVLSLVMGSLAMLERRRVRRSKAVEADATVVA